MTRRKAPEPDEIAHLVVIGSSAGGIDALGALVETLPAHFPAPIIIAQHLDPRRESHLADILGRRSTLPIRTVTDHERLEPGIIFAVPADRHVVIDDHEVHVQSNGGRNAPGGPRATPRPSIDRALSSAAEAYGEGLIAVILTGAGSDGAAGARHVKAAGGTVVIQNPETASYPAMPLSLAPTTVDVVAELEAIGPLLQDLVTGVYVPTKPDEEGILNAFLDEVRETTGIDFSQYKRPTILRRLQRRMVATGTGQLREYIRHVAAHPEEMNRLTNSFLIKVTEFFRDPELYDYLREKVLPDLISAAAQNGGEVRFWSAGCATGEEAYSLAITAAETLAASQDGVRLRIFATDVDGEAIDFARRGIYPAAAVDQVPEELKSRYFIQSAGQFEVAPAIRTMLAFGQHDLAQRAPFPRIDLTICRNVLIYFTNELQRRALQLFAFALRDDGYLILGKAETTSPLSDSFVLEQPRLKVFRRRGTRVVLPATRVNPQLLGTLPQRPTTAARARLAREVGVLRGGVELERARGQLARADRIIMRLPVGVAVVDRKYDIGLINSAARNLLGVHGAAIGQDLVHLVHGVPNNELRRDIDLAFRGEPARSVWEIPTAESTSGEMVALEVTCYRQAESPSVPQDENVTLIVRDVTRERRESSDLVELSSRERLRADRLAGETLNEEMQATNEELETLNEELQATVEELNTTNDDLEARSNELQNLAISLERQREVSEAERARLAAVLLSMADAVVVVDDQGEPTLTNEAFDQTFGDDTVAELLDEGGERLSARDAPWKRAARGVPFSMSFSTTDKGGNRQWYEASGRPLDGDAVKGAVVVIRDVTQISIQKLQNEFLAMLSHELRTPLAGVSAYLELLKREIAAPGQEKAVRYADRALNQATRLTSLVSDLFDANRLRSGRMAFNFKAIELRAVVEDAIAISEPLAGKQRIVLHEPRGPLPVRADPERMQQVVLNLISNAFTHATDSETIDVRLSKRGNAAEIAVEDHGHGISQAEMETLFRRTAQSPLEAARGTQGLGLGLFIARSIVEAHGGSISVTSEPGRGSTFLVRLPMRSPRKSRATSTAARKVQRRKP